MAEVLVELVGNVGRLRLNRPRGLNALSLPMIETMARALDDFEDDPRVARIEVSGAGGRGLCAGADVRALRDTVLADGDTDPFFEAEYGLDLRIMTYPKPVTAVMDGITMGGGMGISMHASDRVVTPTSELAMPETQIGFFPDVLARWHLSRMPDEIGTHLALTGLSVGAGDALWLGLADRCAQTPPPAVLPGRAAWIRECYAGDDAGVIAQRLEEHPDPDARAAASVMRARCPLSVAVALAAVRRAAGVGEVAELLSEELRLARSMVHQPDFLEGVRAQLVDKDRTPRWAHKRVEDVTPQEVAACFDPNPPIAGAR